MAKVNIYILASHRCPIIEAQSYFFKRMKNKDKVKIYFLCTGSECYGWGTEPIYHKYCKELNDAGVETVIAVTNGGDNYMQKIEYAQTQESQYSLSMDEDLWFNENVLDYMIDNAHILDDIQNLAMSPLLSNGIPTCEMFCDDFMSTEEKNEVFNMMAETHIPSMWGANYEHLNQATCYSDGVWNPDKYYSLVAKIQHFYKGIHPVRVNYQLNRRINDIILNKWDKFINVPTDALMAERSQRPYLCNSVFMIKTDVWRSIIANKSLFRDPFDEVPLNIYREQNNLNWVFIRNGYCLHMIYNTVGQKQYEDELMAQCVRKIRS